MGNQKVQIRLYSKKPSSEEGNKEETSRGWLQKSGKNTQGEERSKNNGGGEIKNGKKEDTARWGEAKGG